MACTVMARMDDYVCLSTPFPIDPLCRLLNLTHLHILQPAQCVYARACVHCRGRRSSTNSFHVLTVPSVTILVLTVTILVLTVTILVLTVSILVLTVTILVLGPRLAEPTSKPSSVPFVAYIGMDYIGMAYILMAYVVMDHTVMALYSHGLYSYGPI